MPIAIQCTGCGGRFRAPDAAKGRQVRCPKCSASIQVPAMQTQTQAAIGGASSDAPTLPISSTRSQPPLIPGSSHRAQTTVPPAPLDERQVAARNTAIEKGEFVPDRNTALIVIRKLGMCAITMTGLMLTAGIGLVTIIINGPKAKGNWQIAFNVGTTLMLFGFVTSMVIHAYVAPGLLRRARCVLSGNQESPLPWNLPIWRMSFPQFARFYLEWIIMPPGMVILIEKTRKRLIGSLQSVEQVRTTMAFHWIALAVFAAGMSIALVVAVMR